MQEGVRHFCPANEMASSALRIVEIGVQPNDIKKK